MLKDILFGACCCSVFCGPVYAQPLAGRAAGPEAAVDDAGLVGFVRDTLRYHPRVLAAEAGVQGGEALEQAASRPLFNPEIGLDLEHSDTNDRVLALSQTLDSSGRRDARTAVASTERRVAEQQLGAARLDLTVELLSTLAEYWTARRLDELGALRLGLMERFADVAERRRRAGDITQLDLNIADLARSQARIERAGAAAALAETEQMLLALAPPARAGAWPSLPRELPVIRSGEHDLDALVEAVPEVRIQRQRLAAAEATVALRDRERRASPTLSLVGGEQDDEPMIGLSFTMPLNVRNRYRFEVAAARAGSARAERELENAKLRAGARLEAALRRYTLTHDAWAQWRSAGAPSLAEQTDLLERLWSAGELGVTDYLVQLNQTLDTQASALELERRLDLAWVEWLSASGRMGAWLGLPIETP